MARPCVLSTHMCGPAAFNDMSTGADRACTCELSPSQACSAQLDLTDGHFVARRKEESPELDTGYGEGRVLRGRRRW